MAKQKKNSNYVTEKTTAAKAEREAAKIKEQNDKKIKIIAISVACVVGFIAILFAILALAGAFKYHPEPTDHATVTFDDGSSLHIELYGKDAPETVDSFIDLCDDGYFEGMTARQLVDNLFYLGSKNADGGDNGIKGEFSANGFDNKIPMSKGTVCLSRGEGYDSGYGQFFILTKANSDLFGNYAAFGRVTDMDALEALIDACEIDADGNVTDAPEILSISLHEAHH